MKRQIVVFLTICGLMLLGRDAPLQPSSGSSSFSYPSSFTSGDYVTTYRQVRYAQGYKSATPTSGDVPILVIPVSFSDYPCSGIDGGCDVVREDIRQSFFGEAQAMRWHSVASFYETSSYGQLRFTGVVSDWFTPPITATQLLDKIQYGVTQDVLRPAIDWYRTTYDDSLEQFDADDDGFLDAVYLVYSVPAHGHEEIFVDEDRIFWAYTTYDSMAIASLSLPSPFNYGWSSYDFMYKDGWYERDEKGRLLRDDDDEPVFHPYTDTLGRLLPDAHTFIHEMGHFLGLTDYYTYDYKDGDWGAAGTLDMMDYNVGDHNAFSKSLLSWITPTIVTEPDTFTIRPLVTHGEALLIPITYRGTLLGEYLLVEYYQPTSLNQKDSIEPFAGYYPRLFTNPGIKIYHVDARIGKFVYNRGRYELSDYVEEIGVRTSQVYYGIAHSNTASRSAFPQYKLIHLLEKSGSLSFRHGHYASNTSLFYEGDAFDMNNFATFTFNGGQAFPYNIYIDEINNEFASIRIEQRINEN